MKKTNLNITFKEWIFVIIILIVGIMFYSKTWLLFMNNLNPIIGFAIYYVIWFFFIFILSFFGLSIGGTKIKNIFQITGMMLILFSVNVVLNWTNAYVQYVITGSFDGATQIFYQSEDGILWFLVHNIIGYGDILFQRVIAFGIIPAVIAIIGVLLVTKIKLNMWD